MVFAPAWIARFLEWHIRNLVAKHYGKLSLLSLILTILAAVTISLKLNINSDFKTLLPASSKAVKAMNEVDARIGGGSSLFVVIDSPDQKANIRFAGVYAEALRKMPGVALAHYHNDKTFFKKHQLLYMEAKDLRKLHDRIKKRIRQAKKEANPLFVSLGPPKKSKAISTKDLEKKYGEKLIHQGYKDYLISDDGYALVIIVRFVESSTNMVATNALINQVKDLGQTLKPKTFHSEMTIELGGALAKRQAQYKSIISDIKLSAVFTIIGVLLFIAAYFGRFRAIVLLFFPLIMSVTWALALAFLIFGELTTITVFIFAILLGLGIDFGVHLLSGYDHARLEGLSAEDALVRCYQGTGLATVMGALTTFCTFVVLSFAQFRGLSQFGVVASMGVLATLIAMIVTLPSMVLTFHRILPHKPSQRRQSRAGKLLTASRFERLVRVLLPVALLMIIGGTIFSFQKSDDIIFEENFDKIGKFDWPWARQDQQNVELRKRIAWRGMDKARHVTKQAEQLRKTLNPKTYVPTRHQKKIGQKYSTAVQYRQTSLPTILLFDNAKDAETTYARMETARQSKEVNTWRALNSIYSFMPGSMEEQKARMVEIDKIRKLIGKEPRSFLKKAERKKLDELRRKTDVKPFTIYDLPLWTKRLFKEAGPGAKQAHKGEAFAFEYVIYITEKIGLLDGPQARQYMADIQTVAKPKENNFRIGSQAYVYIAMLDEIKKDGARMMMIALMLVFIILVLGFKNPARALVALIPLGFGAAWTAGMIGWIGIKIDFFNVIIIPALIGIGIDDGIHFYMRYLELGKGSLAKVMRQVGAAVVMTSITSMIGFGGLAITNYNGLKSIGHLAIVGIFAALIATLLLMPTLIWLAERLNLPWIVAPEREEEAPE